MLQMIFVLGILQFELFKKLKICKSENSVLGVFLCLMKVLLTFNNNIIGFNNGYYLSIKKGQSTMEA